MERGELIVIRIDSPREKVRLDAVAVLAHQIVEAAEENALGSQRGIEPCLVGPAIQGNRAAGQLDVLGQQRLGRHGAVDGRRRQIVVLQPEPTDIGPPPFLLPAIGQRQRLKDMPGAAALFGKPRRLTPRREKGVERLLGESGGGSFKWHVVSNPLSLRERAG